LVASQGLKIGNLAAATDSCLLLLLLLLLLLPVLVLLMLLTAAKQQHQQHQIEKAQFQGYIFVSSALIRQTTVT
jgi:hypothetical protein